MLLVVMLAVVLVVAAELSPVASGALQSGLLAERGRNRQTRTIIFPQSLNIVQLLTKIVCFNGLGLIMVTVMLNMSLLLLLVQRRRRTMPTTTQRGWLRAEQSLWDTVRAL